MMTARVTCSRYPRVVNAAAGQVAREDRPGMLRAAGWVSARPDSWARSSAPDRFYSEAAAVREALADGGVTS